MSRIVSAALFLFLAGAGGASSAGPAAATELRPFFDPAAVDRRETITHVDCEAPPPGPKDVLQERPAKDDKDVPESAREEFQELSDVIGRFGNTVAKLADRAVRAQIGATLAADCALTWLAAWAADGALTGRTSKHGLHLRKWELAAYATAYAKVKDWATPQQRVAIETWLRSLARAVIADFSSDLDLPSRRNNHLNWAVWGVASAAAATGDERAWNWARGRYFEILGAVPADGYLPLEMERGRSALGYQMYATAPLVLTAELFERNGIPAYSAANGAIHRLVDVVIAGLEDPSPFEKRSGQPQQLEGLLRPSRLSWLEVYNARFPSARGESLIAALRPLGHRTYGGTLTDLFGPASGAGRR